MIDAGHIRTIRAPAFNTPIPTTAASQHKQSINKITVTAIYFNSGIYKYHREGLDIMSKDVIAGRKEMADALSIMEAGYNNSPNQMLYQMFSDSKAEEVVNIYKVAPTYSERNKVLKHMQKFDPSKARILKELK